MSAARLARALHGLFDGTLIVKAVLATLEAAGGAGLWLTPNASVHALVGWLTRNQIAHDPSECAVQWFAQASASFSVESQHFYALLPDVPRRAEAGDGVPARAPRPAGPTRPR